MRHDSPLEAGTGEVRVATLTLGQAAKLCGVPKSTIARAVKSGRLSASRDDLGQYSIDPAELHRVYAFKVGATDGTDVTGSDEGRAARDATPSATLSNAN